LKLFDEASNETLMDVAQAKLLDATKVPERIGNLIRFNSKLTLDQLKRMREFKVFSPEGLVNDWLDERIQEEEIKALVGAMSNPQMFLDIFDTVSDDALQAVGQGMLLTVKKALPHADKFIRTHPHITLGQLERMKKFDIFSPSALMEELIQHRINKMVQPEVPLEAMPLPKINNKIFDPNDPGKAQLFATFKDLYLHVYSLFLKGKYEEATEQLAALCKRIDQCQKVLSKDEEAADFVLNALGEVVAAVKPDVSHQFMVNLLYYLTPVTAAQKAYAVASLAEVLSSKKINHDELNGAAMLVSQMVGLEMAFSAVPPRQRDKETIASWQYSYLKKLEALNKAAGHNYYGTVKKLMLNSDLLDFGGGEAKKDAANIFRGDPFLMLEYKINVNPNAPVDKLIAHINMSLKDLLAFMIANPRYGRTILKCKKPNVCSEIRDDYEKNKLTPDVTLVAKLVSNSTPLLRDTLRDFPLLGEGQKQKILFSNILKEKLDQEVDELLAKNDLYLVAVRLEDEYFKDELERPENQEIRNKLVNAFPEVLQHSRAVEIDDRTGVKRQVK